MSVHGVVGRPALRGGGGGSKQARARPAYSNPLCPLMSLQHLKIAPFCTFCRCIFQGLQCSPKLFDPILPLVHTIFSSEIAPSGALYVSEHKFRITTPLFSIFNLPKATVQCHKDMTALTTTFVEIRYNSPNLSE